MNPQEDRTSGLGLPQPGNDTSQLPPIHAPQAFHAPDGAVPRYGIDAAPLPVAAPASPPTQPLSAPPAAIAQQPAAGPIASSAAPDPLAAVNAQFSSASPAQTEEIDTPFDEEWVGKAKEIVDRTHTDPYMQSRELSRLKAQYIKARYNKDIKVSEE